MDVRGSYSSDLFNKDADNMMPFTKTSKWNFAETQGVTKRTLHPTVTGASVLGVCFDKGVMICADILGSYGSMARFRDCQRVVKVNDQTILGVGGDFADFQFMWSVIEQQIITENCLNDGFNLKPKSLYCWLTRVLYNRRTKLDPLWNVFVVGGMEDGVPFLGLVDKLGTAYRTPTIATGFGSYLAQPILRDAYEKTGTLNEQEARDLLTHCMRILYYRDARSFPKYTLAIVTESGAKVEGPLTIDSDWSIGHSISDY